MKTVTLDVRTLADTLSDAVTAMETLTPTEPRISFETPELLWKVLTAKRWDIIKALTGAEPVSIREVARRVGRDVKAVHGDVHALLLAGLIDKTEDGKVVFPYEALHVDFMIKAA
jgi:predicted transcriptional regulator